MDNRTQIKIRPISLKGSRKQGLDFTYILEFTPSTRRQVTIHTPWAYFHNKPWDPQRLLSVITEVMARSDIPFRMTESQFMNLSWKQFDKVQISDRLLLEKQ